MKINQDMVIEKNAGQLFALAQDYNLRLQWDPFLKEMSFLDGASEAAKGVQVWVKSNNGLTMTVEYLTVAPPNHVSMHMVSGPRIFHKFSGKWSFTPIDNNCKVSFRYKYALKTFFLFLSPFVRYKMNRDMRRRLVNLKEVAENIDILTKLS